MFTSFSGVYQTKLIIDVYYLDLFCSPFVVKNPSSCLVKEFLLLFQWLNKQT